MNNIHQRPLQSRQSQQGLTLVEILVALVISLFLIAGVIQLFVGSKQTYRGQDALSRIQENGRFAIERIAWDLRMAGYVDPRITPAPAVVAIAGNDGAANDDSITVQWNNGAANFRAYSLMCNGGGNPPCGAQQLPTLALQLQPPPANRQMLIENVAQMQILYGVCVGGVVNPPYVNAAAVVDWNNVCSVQVDLLLASADNNLVTQPQTYFYQGGLVTAADRRFYQAFSTTVAIRNRILR